MGRHTTKAANYVVLSFNDPSNLSKEVSNRLSTGWLLYGEPFTSMQNSYNGNANDNYCQAMIKTRDD